MKGNKLEMVFYVDTMPNDMGAMAKMCTSDVIAGAGNCEKEKKCCVCCLMPGMIHITFSVTGEECGSAGETLWKKPLFLGDRLADAADRKRACGDGDMETFMNTDIFEKVRR
eukprot:gnl/MRDRNA2_/MRDRNA2_85171_c0_seq2.p1 gnl/MRDRNA2_/MRDRNA2_85171_c0~~gnl/MRDRNA2_/MRDRNA2_85171_c0_seq2.p1  ORF type:complete len:112 (-),score=19.19 gnl/MRDRNA2_/MRDRNA2_85171_c0_seq2:94-429(-)